MSVTMESSAQLITAFIDGEIDHHSAQEIRRAIDDETDRLLPKVLRLDFSGVTFMDSSGIGLVMGRQRNVMSYGGKTEVVNLPAQCYKVMKLARLDRIAKIELKEAGK